MEITIYADVLFGWNFLIDLFLLSVTVSLSRTEWRLGRMTLSAGMLALYGTMAFFPKWQILGGVAGKLIAGALALWILTPFDGWAKWGKRGVIFFLAAAVSGGVMYALALGEAGQMLGATVANGTVYLPIRGGVLAAGIFLSYGLLFLFRKNCVRQFSKEKLLIDLEIKAEGRRICLRALADTGCELTSPWTGEGVLLLSPSVADKICPVQTAWLEVGTVTGEGRIAAFLPEEVSCRTSGYRMAELPLIAVAKEELAKDGLYAGVFNPVIIEEWKETGGRWDESKRILALVAETVASQWKIRKETLLLHRRKRIFTAPPHPRGGGKGSGGIGRSREDVRCQKDLDREESSAGGIHCQKV